jgi:hypothetical protein
VADEAVLNIVLKNTQKSPFRKKKKLVAKNWTKQFISDFPILRVKRDFQKGIRFTISSRSVFVFT